jgi:DDE superfamily endonuclease
MSLCHLPALLSCAFAQLASCLDPRSAVRLPLLLVGILLAKGRRTVTSWFRACGITDEYRRGYATVAAVGRRTDWLATRVLHATEPLLPHGRLLAGIDDTPTPRFGPCVEGAGVHHNPSQGPAGDRFVYGHVWVTLAALARHPQRGATALPLQAQLYVRRADLPKLPPDRRRPFATKLELAAGQLHWLRVWAGHRFRERWVAADGGYAKRPFLRAARREGFVVASRLRKDAALWSVPEPPPPGRPGRKPVYGKQRVSLAKRAGQARGWQEVECFQYGRRVTKTVKSFVATWRPASGAIRVVLVKEEGQPGGWVPFFCTDPEAAAAEVLEAVADRTALEQTFKDAKEVWGAGQQQVRNVHSSAGCFNLCLWLYSLVEAWAWAKAEQDLVDRSASPWDNKPRRPSHQDKRKAVQREVLRGEIRQALCGRPSKQKIRALGRRLLELAG